MSKYELVVMGFLNDRPMHGYQINKQTKIHRMDSWAMITAPMIYTALGKLEKAGMIKLTGVEREGFMPERRIYRLTPKGKQRLALLVEKSLMGKDLTRDLSNLGYFFLLALSKEKAQACLNRRGTLLENTIKSLKRRRDEFKGKTPINHLLVIERDLDRFKRELSHLRRMISSMDT